MKPDVEKVTEGVETRIRGGFAVDFLELVPDGFWVTTDSVDVDLIRFV